MGVNFATSADVYAALNRAVAVRGGAARLAEKSKVSEALVSQSVNAHKPLSDKVAVALGFRKIVVYEVIK